MHRRMPTDDNLRARGLITVSMCPLCCSTDEAADHLFLSCNFAQLIWLWLNGVQKYVVDQSSIPPLLNVCSRFRSSHAKDLVLAAMINVG